MWVNQIARFHHVWVITRANNRQTIEAALTKESLPGVHWIYFDLPHWMRFWKRQQKGAHIYYYLWQLFIYFVARRLHRTVTFDIIHHVTFGQYWIPSYLGLLPVPFIWGPVGGGESAPRSFWWNFSRRGKRFEVLRNLARHTAALNPVMHIVARRACLSIATTEQTAVKLRRLGAKNVVVHPQFGMTDQELQYFRDFPIRNSPPFRLVSIGRLIHWKGFHLSLRAFASFHRCHPESEYWILSAGPEGHNLKALAAQLGIEDSVLFWGGFPTIRQVHEKLAQCDVLVHPALHEAFGNVCLEAMAAGRPVVCLDLGGPALQVTPDTGIEVPAVKCDQVVTDLSVAFSRLADDPAFRITLGRAARERVADHFTWDKYGEWMSRVYCSAQTSRYAMPAVPVF